MHGLSAEVRNFFWGNKKGTTSVLILILLGERRRSKLLMCYGYFYFSLSDKKKREKEKEDELFYYFFFFYFYFLSSYSENITQQGERDITVPQWISDKLNHYCSWCYILPSVGCVVFLAAHRQYGEEKEKTADYLFNILIFFRTDCNNVGSSAAFYFS